MKKEPRNWTMPEWMEPYREVITNTGGNSIEDLMNDTDSNFFNNSIRASLIVAVESQIQMLTIMRREGMVTGPVSNALKVLVLTPHIKEYLTQTDPKALEQAERALSNA